MMIVAEERSINRKLTAITKGNKSGALDRIEIATYDWFHTKKELYYYEGGGLRHTHGKTENFFYTPLSESATRVCKVYLGREGRRGLLDDNE